MGGSSSKSKVTQVNNNFVTNTENINVLNSFINSTIVNSTVNQVKQCSASLINNQTIKILGVKAGEDLNLYLAQDSTGFLNFTCAQNSKVLNSVIGDLTQNILSTLKTNIGADVLNKLDALAASKSTQDWGAFPWSSSKSKTDTSQEVNNTVINTTNKNLETVISNSVESNFTMSDFSSCLAKVIANQDIVAQDLTAGRNITLSADQKVSTDLFQNCIQSSDIANNITSAITGFLEIETDTVQSTELAQESHAESISKAEQTGLFQGIGSMFNSIYSGLGNLFGGVLGGVFGAGTGSQYGPYVSSCSLCCCCLIIILIILYVVFGSFGEQEGGSRSRLKLDNSMTSMSSLSSMSNISSISSPIYNKYDLLL
jgi:hypothetical protein